MTLYFSISDVLEQLNKIQIPENRMHTLIPVSFTAPFGDDHKEDTFSLTSYPKLLDLNDEGAPHQLALLLNEVPLYKINLELLLDDALTERHHNDRLQLALEETFQKDPLPSTLHNPNGDHDDHGNLRHPIIKNFNSLKLAEIYIDFIKNLGTVRHNYGFEINVIGKHSHRFIEHYDGFLTTTGGKIKADILIGFGVRQDYVPGISREQHIEKGRSKAHDMNIDDAKELIWAWLECDHYQMRRCYDIDNLLKLEGLPRIPNWVRADVLCILEKESMKQVFAEKLLGSAHGDHLIEHTPKLHKAIEENKNKEINAHLDKLLSQTLNVGEGYSGVASQFFVDAQARDREAKKSRLF